MYAAEGRFTFTSHTSGEHQICLHSNSTAWFGGGKMVSHQKNVSRLRTGRRLRSVYDGYTILGLFHFLVKVLLLGDISMLKLKMLILKDSYVFALTIDLTKN